MEGGAGALRAPDHPGLPTELRGHLKTTESRRCEEEKTKPTRKDTQFDLGPH